MALELPLHRIPGFPVDDRIVHTGMMLPLVSDLANIDRVLQQLVEMAAREGSVSRSRAIVRAARLGTEPRSMGRFLHLGDRTEIDIKSEQSAHGLGLGRV